MNRTLTKEEIAELEPFEPYFRKAIFAKWSPYPGASALMKMHAILGDGRKLNASCQHCVLKLIQDCGRLYYDARSAVESQNASKVDTLPTTEEKTQQKRKSTTKKK